MRQNTLDLRRSECVRQHAPGTLECQNGKMRLNQRVRILERKQAPICLPALNFCATRSHFVTRSCA
jgi:hypothetical protein